MGQRHPIRTSESRRPQPERSETGIADHIGSDLRSAYQDIFLEPLPKEMVDAARAWAERRRRRG